MDVLMNDKSLYWRAMFANVIDEIGNDEFERANIDQKYVMLCKKLTFDCDNQEQYDESINAICEFLEY